MGKIWISRRECLEIMPLNTRNIVLHPAQQILMLPQPIERLTCPTEKTSYRLDSLMICWNLLSGENDAERLIKKLAEISRIFEPKEIEFTFLNSEVNVMIFTLNVQKLLLDAMYESRYIWSIGSTDRNRFHHTFRCSELGILTLRMDWTWIDGRV